MRRKNNKIINRISDIIKIGISDLFFEKKIRAEKYIKEP